MIRSTVNILPLVFTYFIIWLMLDTHLPKKICIICFFESPLKMMKNAFYFILRALFVLKIFSFCHDFLVLQEKRLNQKDKVNFKIRDITTWLTKVAIHIFPNISRSKCNQTLKLGQLIEYNKRNIFLKNYAENEAGETSSRPVFIFIKKPNMR